MVKARIMPICGRWARRRARVHTRYVRWAQGAVICGAVLLAAGFGLGVEPAEARLGQQAYSCATAIPLSWLEPGAPAVPAASGTDTVTKQQVKVECGAATDRRRTLAWSTLSVGFLVALVGWTTLRESGRRRLEARSTASTVA